MIRLHASVTCFAGAAVTAAAAAGDLSQPGPYLAGVRTVTVTRTSPGGGTFSAKLFYPAIAAGTDTALDPAGAPYPVVSFGHGFLQPVSQYQSTLGHLASHGVIVIASESNTGLAPSHTQLAQDLRDSLTWVEQESAASGAFLSGAADATRCGLAGHSMGGGCAILAAAAEGPRLRAVAPLAPAETSTSAISAMGLVEAPIALITGTQDTIVPTAGHGQPMYANGRAPKQLLSIVGGFHCGFTDAGFLFCDSGSISRAQQLAVTRGLLTSWFNLHLRGEQSEWRAWWGPESAGTPALTRVAASGVTITPPPGATEGYAGFPIGADVTIGNTGPRGNSFEVMLDPAPFGVSATPLIAGPMAPGERAAVRIALAPDEASLPRTVEVFVSARSAADGATRAWARVPFSILCAGDADRDGQVGLSDIALVITNWASAVPQATGGDVTNDGAVALDDIAAIIAAWGRACPAR